MIAYLGLFGVAALLWVPRAGATTISAFRKTSELTVVPLRAAINRDTRYGVWLNPTAVLYRLDPAYTPAETVLIRQAMDQIATDMSRCIVFSPWTTANQGSDFLYISKTLNNGVATPTCFSFPGRVLTQAGQGQKLALFGTAATNGCMDSQRDIMKYLVHSLGLRNEYNRPDRNTYMTVQTANIKPELQSLDIFRLYTAAQVDYTNSNFDFNSITIPPQTKYAATGTVAFTPVTAGQAMGTLPRLSQGDCTGLALLYAGCSVAACQNPYATTTNAVAGTAVAGTAVAGTAVAGTAVAGGTVVNGGAFEPTL